MTFKWLNTLTVFYGRALSLPVTVQPVKLQVEP